ncbi:unnamed protein product [Rhizophagus irregularis]|nr:unnamed protein product [Rhizophagus irregularis]
MILTTHGGGGFSKIFKADWPKGRIICSGIKTTKWWREDRTIQVALKSINDSRNIIKEFLEELQNHLKYLHYFSDETSQHKASRLLIHGITREPSTNNFTLVTDYMVRGSLRTRLQNPDLPQFEWSSVLLSLRDLSICLSLMHEAGLIHRDIHSGNILSDKPLTKEQEEFGKIFAAAEEYRLNIGHGGAGKGQIVGFAKHPEAWTVSRLLDFSFLEKNPQKPELEIVDEEKEILDKTGYLITYRSTQLLEIPDED